MIEINRNCQNKAENYRDEGEITWVGSVRAISGISRVFLLPFRLFLAYFGLFQGISRYFGVFQGYIATISQTISRLFRVYFALFRLYFTLFRGKVYELFCK